ncbi:MAG: NfeD family protein [Solirubrobacterales bacterium]
METVAIIAGVAVALLIVELLLPTGGVLALLGALGLVAAGIVALGDDTTEAADYIGPGLITLGVLSAATFFVITPKIIRAHRDEPVQSGREELAGKEGEVRAPLNPEGQIWIDGGLWRARVADGEPEVSIGTRVRIESIDGLTLVVRPVGASESATKGPET